jgi:glycosyltransferase involved in cell wall biosynthesis
LKKLLVACQAAPTSTAAYGRVGREIATNLVGLQPGYEVALLGTHGQPALTHTVRETFDDQTVDVISHPYPWAYFDGIATNRIAKDLGADTILYIGDAWAHAQTILEAVQDGMPWYLHCPIDHSPLCPAEMALIQHVEGWAVPTKWGTQSVNDSRNGMGFYVPHGVSKDLFQRIGGETREEQRLQAVITLGWETELSRYLCVANNVGDRKHIPNLIRAWKDADLDNAELVLWSYPTRDAINPEAQDLLGAAQSLGVTNIRFPDPYKLATGYPDAELGLVYAASDVLLCVTKTEGFGIPIAEAQAIGIPAIVTDYEPFLEVAGASSGDSLTVKTDSWELQQMLGGTWMPIPTHSGTVKALKYFHQHQHSEGLKQFISERTAHARNYTWGAAARKLDAMLRAPGLPDVVIPKLIIPA